MQRSKRFRHLLTILIIGTLITLPEKRIMQDTTTDGTDTQTTDTNTTDTQTTDTTTTTTTTTTTDGATTVAVQVSIQMP
jgi:hypothetical protein